MVYIFTDISLVFFIDGFEKSRIVFGCDAVGIHFQHSFGYAAIDFRCIVSVVEFVIEPVKVFQCRFAGRIVSVETLFQCIEIGRHTAEFRSYP